MIKISFATNWWFGTTIISWRSSRSLAASTRGAFKKWSSHYQHSSIHTRNDEARNNIRKSALYDTQWAKYFVKSSNAWKLRGGMGIVSKNQFSVPKISQRFWLEASWILKPYFIFFANIWLPHSTTKKWRKALINLLSIQFLEFFFFKNIYSIALFFRLLVNCVFFFSPYSLMTRSAGMINEYLIQSALSATILFCTN